jgi:PhoH-like ATPase
VANKQKLVIDTCVFMEGINILEELIQEYDVYIPYVILQELDHHKDRGDGWRSFKGRTAIKFINANFDKFNFIETENGSDIGNDDLIISTAKQNNCAVATYDICMKVKCKTLDIPLVELNNDEKEYKGYKIVEIDTSEDNDNQWLANTYEKPQENPCELLTNEYLIIRDKANPIWDNDDFNQKIGYKTIDIFRWDGNELVGLRLPPKKVVKPMNDLQTCALDLLMDKDIPIKVICGKAGGGKTYLATKMGIHHLIDKGNYSKIMMVRNPYGSGEEIGFLPGSKQEKIQDFFNPIVQHLDFGEIEAEKLMQSGRLIAEIPFFMKGLDIQDTYIIVEEAEDMDKSTIKLIGTRVSKNSCVVFSGDYNQSENKFKYNNGLIELINVAKGNKMFGCLVLDDDLRSEASKLFADLM